MRLQKFLAAAGIGSRRACETTILEGRVEVNGLVVRRLGSRVDPEADRIRVDGRPVAVRRRLYVALHKPAGCVCSRRPQGGQPGVLNLLPVEWQDVYPVGRLDRESEGLLLLTNDGDFCLRMTHPRYGVPKVYVVTVTGPVEPGITGALTRGIRDRGEHLRAREARVVSVQARRSRLEVLLTEGRNREVRRLFTGLGVAVERLVRRQIGPVSLGELPAGKWRVLQPAEVKALLAAARPATGTGGARSRPGAGGSMARPAIARRGRRVTVDTGVGLTTNLVCV